MTQNHPSPAAHAGAPPRHDSGSLEVETAGPDPAARLGADDATRIIAGQYIAGVHLDQIRAHHEDVAACLLADARTPPGRAYAEEYSATAFYLIGHLSQDQAVASGRSAAACAQPDGTAHPDPQLAARGWQADRGIWQRSATPQAGQETRRP